MTRMKRLEQMAIDLRSTADLAVLLIEAEAKALSLRGPPKAGPLAFEVAMHADKAMAALARLKYIAEGMR